MDFLSNFAKSDEAKKPTSDQPNNPADGHHNKPSNSDLFSSAKLVADAAQCQFRGEPEKYDKGKAAGAAADLLNCASEYGKLDETKGIGKYLDQAEDYLHKYQTTTTTTTVGDSGEHKTTTTTATAVTTNPEKDSSGDYIKMAEGFLNKPSSGAASGEGGGAGDYVKMAQGFLNKPSGGGEGGGAGDFMKMAGDFLKK